jgi:NTE family protein
MKKYKTGLVLSGGGTRGFAHLGVISALYEKGVIFDVISGTSVGAIVGAFIAGGMKPDEIMMIFNKGWFFKYTNLQFPADGLLKLNGLKGIIQKTIPYRNIEDLPLPFYISVANLNSGAVEYRNKGPLGLTLLASSSIPVLFSPVKIDGQMYVDGGLMDNIPVGPIKDDCEHIISVNITPLNPREKIKNLIQIASRTFYMGVNANMTEVHNYSSLYIEPEGIDMFDILSLSHAAELFELGYNSVKDITLPF